MATHTLTAATKGFKNKRAKKESFQRLKESEQLPMTTRHQIKERKSEKKVQAQAPKPQ